MSWRLVSRGEGESFRVFGGLRAGEDAFSGETPAGAKGECGRFCGRAGRGNVRAAQGRAGLGNRGAEGKRESAATLRRMASILSSPFSLQSRLPLERGRKIFAACLLRRPGTASRRHAPPQAARQAPEQKNACQNRKKGIYSPTNIKSGRVTRRRFPERLRRAAAKIAERRFAEFRRAPDSQWEISPLLGSLDKGQLSCLF